MGGRVGAGLTYRTGRSRVRVTFRDGRVWDLPPHALIRFPEPPEKVEGRLVRVGRTALYETQNLRPEGR